MIKVVWEKSALDRHEQWALNIAVEFTWTHTQTYLAEIQNAENNISHLPLVGTTYDKSLGRQNVRRLVTASGYSVYYEIDSLSTPSLAIIFSVIRNHLE